jgi:hypothetical protein
MFGGGYADGSNAAFYGPTGVAADANGNVIVADCNNHRIRKVTPGGGTRIGPISFAHALQRLTFEHWPERIECSCIDAPLLHSFSLFLILFYASKHLRNVRT